MFPEVALMVVEPAPAEVARPALSMGATVVSEDVQVTDEVRSCVLPSEYVPVAVNCCVAPRVMLESAGAIVRETRTGDAPLPPHPIISSRRKLKIPKTAIFLKSFIYEKSPIREI